MKRIKMSDLYYLLGTVIYLGQKGFVKLQTLRGGKFYIRLDARGLESLRDVTIDNALVMSCAYRILFDVENRMRQFIESRMRSKYGSDWWNHVSLGIRNTVDRMKQDESKPGWQVSATTNNTDYLLFEHLDKIIEVNWKDVFESVFHNQ